MRDTVQPALKIIDDALRRIAQAFGINTSKIDSQELVLKGFKAILSATTTAIQLAAIALTLGNCTVVTTDSDLAAVPGLRTENWAAP